MGYVDKDGLEEEEMKPIRFFSSFFLQRQTSNRFSFDSGLKSRVGRKMEEDDADFFGWPQSESDTNVTEIPHPLLELDDINNATTSNKTIQTPVKFLDSIYDAAIKSIAATTTPQNDYQINNSIFYPEEELQTESSETFNTFLTFPNGTTNSSSDIFRISLSPTFDISEYAVFGSVLLLSAAVGVFYGCFGKGQKTTDEYLIANREMSTIPAALSLLCSFVSALSILGNPLEIYNYGSSYGLIVFTFIPLTVTLAYFYVPVFFNLQLNSAYEYFELRFNRPVRIIVSIIGILHYVVYMSIVVYGPALAIGQVTGINVRISTGIIFFVCIFYSTLGGLRAVVVTDSLQALIMISSLAAVIIKGTLDLGGVNVVWEIAEKFGRTKFFNFDYNLTTRHTFWTAVIGGYLQWLPNFAATHSQIQRYLSMPSLASIRRALLLNLIGFTLIFGLCYWAGLILFAKFHSCDPLKIGIITKQDQLLPLFVMETMSVYPGLPALFLSGLTCASLSTVSTGLNALSAIVTYDYLKNWMPDLSDAALLRFSKSLCLIFGLISFGLIFVAENLGNILPAAFAIAGIVVGPTLGTFTLGMFFPYANAKGSLFGLLSSFFIMITLFVGNQIAISENLLMDQTLPGLSIEGCTAVNILRNPSNNFTFANNITAQRQIADFSFGYFEDWGNDFLLNFFSISYMWFPGLGCVFSIFFGLLFSLVLSCCDKSKPVNPNHLSPPILWIMLKLFPNHSLKWIDLDDMDDCNGPFPSRSSATMSLRTSNFSFRKESVCDMKLKRVSVLPHPIQFPIPQFQPPSMTSSENTNSTDSLL